MNLADTMGASTVTLTVRKNRLYSSAESPVVQFFNNY